MDIGKPIRRIIVEGEDWFAGPLGLLACIAGVAAVVGLIMFITFALLGEFDPTKIEALKAPWAK